jgi:hypothetical protein
MQALPMYKADDYPGSVLFDVLVLNQTLLGSELAAFIVPGDLYCTLIFGLVQSA